MSQTVKKVSNQTDSLARTLYAKIDATSEYAYPILITTDGSLKIVQQGAASVVSGRKVVAVTGSAVQLTTSSISCFKVDLSADLGNTDAVVVGAVGVVASSGTQVGIAIIPGNPPHTIFIDNLNKIYVDSLVNGEAICFNYYAY